MPSQIEDILRFWGELLEDTEAKPSDRLKASEDLAKYLETARQSLEPPARIVISYVSAPDSPGDSDSGG